MQRPTVDERFWHLADSGCHGLLDTHEAEELESLLSGNAELCRLYLDYCQLHTDLHFFVCAEQALDTVRARLIEESNVERVSPARPAPGTEQTLPPDQRLIATRANTSPVLGFLGTGVNMTASWLSSPKVLVVGIAGGLLTYFCVLVVSLALTPAPLKPSAGAATSSMPGQKVASLVDDGVTRWSPASAKPIERGLHIGERYELQSGRVEMVVDRGVCVGIEGPAIWRLASEQRLIFDSGRLAASVPSRAIGFTVVTPTAEIVDLGTEFGVEVEPSGETAVHVVRGVVEVKQSVADRAKRPVAGVRISAGSAVRVATGQKTASIPFDDSRFAPILEAVAKTEPDTALRSTKAGMPLSKIWLGNLFDDRPHTPLAAAMLSDTFRATADTNDLGVHKVIYGGQAVQEIFPGLRFDFSNLGWNERAEGYRVTNDAWTNSDEVRGYGFSPAGGIRLSGDVMSLSEPRIEEGIGMVPDAIVTFDLDDIRAAGGFVGRRLEFISDLAGVNDSALVLAPADHGTLHLVALVSTTSKVQAAMVDGQAAAVAEHEDRWSLAGPIGKPLCGGGPFVSFRVPIAPNSKYLSLISTCAGDGHNGDMGTWLGARLEVQQ